ncbi:helicase [Nitrosarchaeum sp.]|nr:helicase [Nitrosarchaeum sp.]
MREIFVTDLIKNVLGPRNGIDEEIEQNPLSEYITGILSPAGSNRLAHVSVDDQAEMPFQDGRNMEDDDIDQTVNISSLLAPALDPKNVPSSMGISFLVESNETPKIHTCLTWARYYEVEGKTPKTWRRHSRNTTIEIELDHDEQIFHVDATGNISNTNPEISLHVYVRKRGHVKHVTVLLVNRIQFPEDGANVVHHIFQPQIRILCVNNTRLVEQGLNSKSNDGMELQYKNRPVFARGHLTSAIWKEIDPEVMPLPIPKIDFNETLQSPGFFWIDGLGVKDVDRTKFTKSDIRTDYVPMYSISAPSLEWNGSQSNAPELLASRLAECFDAKALRSSLIPLADEYRKWIDGLKKQNIDPKHKTISEKIISDCEIAYIRITDGIEKICSDKDAMLAFCFANKAIDLQSIWQNNLPFTYRPFQLAFILASVESTLNPSSRFRDTCDLLWVPTGGGKTEAYLVIVAMVLVFRRIKSLKGDLTESTGAGVAVISRYTLRLLTIQQFRRSLSIITACEYLRVNNFGSGKNVGWRPKLCPNTNNVIWGSTPFSAGLWVGTSVTPNRLKGTIRAGRAPLLGAIDVLRERNPQGEHGEPAQVLNCPACKNILAIPDIGLHSGTHEIHFVFECSSNAFTTSINEIKSHSFQTVEITNLDINGNSSPGHFTLSLQFRTAQFLKSYEVNQIWNQIQNTFSANGIRIILKSSKPSRPGYFLRRWIKSNRSIEDYDFDIFCTNPKCPLKINWFGGMPLGKVHGRQPDTNSNSDTINGVTLPDGNFLIDIHESFENQRFMSDRIPIPAYTVDEQVYRNLPSIVIGTVDKFARLSFEPNTASLFGNVEYYHSIWGYGRVSDDGIPSPSGRTRPFYYIDNIPCMAPPNLIIQDELHLIEGPLGSMVGIYETAIDFLSQQNMTRPKYIASTATIKRSEEHVQAVFTRNVMTFPPSGLSTDDRFFIKESEQHPIVDKDSGRLYIGICAPGKGALTPLVRIWARLAQTGQDHSTHHNIDPFWTITGYFNAVRELAGARALYRQDIPEWVRHISVNPRPLPEDQGLELSSRTPSTDLPSILNILNRPIPDAPDGLFTTSMFGTGVDISRIGLMIVNGQPKTTSSYIQSTGRVGRKSGALVVTFFRASRPRDLSHYEFFSRHHRQMHRFVEPPTVFPFAPGVQERSLGPVVVAILRNMRNPVTDWSLKSSAPLMETQSNNAEVNLMRTILENRAQQQPPGRKPTIGDVENLTNSEIDRWRAFAQRHQNNLAYSEYFDTRNDVVLGDPPHFHAGRAVVYRNAPQSLREIEEETGFET